MQDNIEKIKERVDIVDLVSSYLKLNKAGANYKANCPFHNEKTPSFYVSPERQIWHCFGCQKGGDQFAFVQEIDGVEFPEALKVLARRAGVELEHFDRSFNNEKTRLLEICGLASRFFQKQLWESATGKKVLAYLKDRGVEERSIRNFGLGYAPESWDSLGNFLKTKGFSEQEVFSAGLAVKREGASGYYDRFRSRIIFPIADLNGQTVGFTGRVFEIRPEHAEGQRVEQAKYINTPQTLIYDKSRVLYGLDKAKVEIRKADQCMVVEGNMDVILAHQAGTGAVVASSGTALTGQHLKIIKRYTNNLNLCLDQDTAGLNATERGIGLALQQDFNVGVVSLDDPECKDPADYIKKHGAKWLERLISPKAIVEFYLENAMKTFDAETAVGKKMIAEKVLPVIKDVANGIERSHWIAELALRLKVKEEILLARMGEMKTRPASLVSAGEPDARISFLSSATADALEEYLFSLLLVKPELFAKVEKRLAEVSSEKVKSFLTIFSDYAKLRSYEKPLDYIIETASSGSQDKMYWEKLYLRAKALWPENIEPDLEKEFGILLNQLAKRNLMAQLASLEFSIRQAEKEKNKSLVLSLASQFQLTASHLNQIQSSNL